MQSPATLELSLDSLGTPDEIPFTSSDSREYSQGREDHDTKTDIVVDIARVVPDAVRRTTIRGIIVPRTAAHQLVTQPQPMCHQREGR